MQELFPDPRNSVDPAERYRSDVRRTDSGRPWVLLNMITSVDGATASGSRSGDLSGPADRSIFMVLRSLADVIIVGAGTMHHENYGPPRLSSEAIAWRRSEGMADLPRIATVSGSLSVNTGEKAFGNPDQRPWLITKAESDDDRRQELSSVADIIVAGSDAVDLADAVDQLHAVGAGVILCEGGPTLNGALFDQDLVDEICWTIAPSLVGGKSRRLIAEASIENKVDMKLDRILEDGGFLFMRYVRS